MSGKGALREEKGFTLFSSNEDMNDIIKIIKSLESSGVLIIVQLMIYSVVKGISGRGIRRAGKGYINKIF